MKREQKINYVSPALLERTIGTRKMLCTSPDPTYDYDAVVIENYEEDTLF